MCEECYMTFCPETCPEYETDMNEAVGRCDKCGAYIYSDEDHVRTDEKLFCSECVEKLDTDAILMICGFGAVLELLRELGVESAGKCRP